MYVKNLSELKKAIKNNEQLIQVKDEKFKAKVLKSAMKKGRLYDHNGKKIFSEHTMAKISESVMIIYAILGLVALLGLYAIYKKHNLKVIINLDGTLTFESEAPK